MEHKTTPAQDRDFIDILFDGLTNDVIEAIKNVLYGETDWVLEWVADNFEPDEVFNQGALERWAESQGWSDA